MSATMSAPPLPEKSKFRQKLPKSRFVEQFDMIPPTELLETLQETDFHVGNTRKRAKANTATSRPLLSSSYSSSTLSTSYKLYGTSDHPPTMPSPEGESSSSSSNNPNNPKPSTSFWNAPTMKRTNSSRSRKEDCGGNNVENSRASVAKGTASVTKINTLFSLNRAEVIITRLEDWLVLLKAVIGWLEEAGKIHFQCSRGYSQRTLPLVKSDADSDEKDAKATIQVGLQMLSLNVAEQHKVFGKRVQLDLLPGLHKLRKDCKEMIKGLKEEPDLLMDELLRLAETTRKSMTTLNKHCKAAAGSDKVIEHDPMISNLYVLRHLKREVDEENRMRELMVPIQKGTVAFEKRVLEQVKAALAYCYGFLAPKLWDGVSPSSSSSSASVDEEDEEVTPYKLVLKQLTSEYEWNRFYESKKKDLVDEIFPKKEYLKINYPNKTRPYVMTVAKGVLGRRVGVLKQFSERYYILSHCGFLHEFAMNDKVSPERSIYIPECEIFDTSMGSKNRHTASHDDSGGRYTFEVHKKGTQVLQRDRVYTFRANSCEELKSWYDVLRQASTGTIPIPTLSPLQPIPQKQQKEQQQREEGEEELEQKHERQPAEHQQSLGPPQSIARSQHSNHSNASIGQATAPTRSHHSHPSLVGDECNHDGGSTRSSIMTAKPFAAEDNRVPATSSDLDNERQVDSAKDAKPEEKQDEARNDDEVHEDIVESVAENFGDAPRPKMPRTGALFEDGESSVYFSSTSAPPSPTSTVSEDYRLDEIAIPTLEDNEEDMPTMPRIFNPPRGDFYTPMINYRL